MSKLSLLFKIIPHSYGKKNQYKSGKEIIKINESSNTFRALKRWVKTPTMMLMIYPIYLVFAYFVILPNFDTPFSLTDLLLIFLVPFLSFALLMLIITYISLPDNFEADLSVATNDSPIKS